MSKNILILDDEPNVVSALSRLLRRNEYIVYESLNVDD
ncbi:MAG: CheY-like chemotaxis protein, partial [Francisellaceae bacterium]